MNFTFNLIDEPWIPCILPQGNGTRYLGIADTLIQARQIKEIHDASPLVTVSLHRLLLAILYRAFAPVETKGQWLNLWKRGQFAANRIEAYLSKWRDRFDLFGESHPFYQTAGLETSRPDTVSRLATEAASGNNPTLFDHRVDAALVEYSPADAARMLVAAQSCALGGGNRHTARMGTDRGILRPNYADAILAKDATFWLSGYTLFQTLMLNLARYRAGPRDLPCWERDDPHALMDTVSARGRRTHPARGSLDRFTWQSRLVRLLPENRNGSAVVRHLYFAQGRSADKSLDDPMKAYRKSKQQGILPFSLSPEKAVWRDLHALLTLERQEGKPPEAVNSAAQMIVDGVLEQRYMFQLNVVGLAKKQAKPLLWRHDRMPLPAALLQDADLIENLGMRIGEAEDMATGRWGIRERLRRVCRFFLAPDSDKPQGRKPHPDDISRLLNNLNPLRVYWARLEHDFHELLQHLAAYPDRSRERWRDAVEREARRSFREACDALGTSARAIRAVARVGGGFRIGAPQRESRKPEETAAL